MIVVSIGYSVDSGTGILLCVRMAVGGGRMCASRSYGMIGLVVNRDNRFLEKMM